MASEWTQWYPHEIDAWQGSATIQTFSDAGYRAFHNLIMVEFQQPNGKLIDDDVLLAKQSRMGARWTAAREGLPTIAEEVRACFVADSEGFIYNPKQFAKWEHAHAKHLAYMERMEAARRAKAAHHASVHTQGNSDMDSSIDRATDCLIDNSIPRAERESERESKSKDSYAETSSAPPAAFLPLASGDEFPISVERLQSWEKAFPGVEIEGQIQRMRVWLDANPTRRITRRGALKFAVSWLSREQDSGPQRRGGYAGTGSGISINRNQQRTNSNLEAARSAAASIGAEILDWPGGGPASIGKRGDVEAVFSTVE